MKKVFILFITVFFMFSCEDDQTRESEDCAGVNGGDNVCGCTDDQAMNFDSTASICPFLLNEVKTTKLTKDLSLWSSLKYSLFDSKALSNVFP